MIDGEHATVPSYGIGVITPAISPLTPEMRAELVLQRLWVVNKDLLKTLAPEVRKRVDTLRRIQREHDELEAKFFEERSTLEAKYQKLYEPLYSKRCEIVNGVVEIEDITEGGDEAPVENKGGKGVPYFWLNAMKKNEILTQEIQKEDEAALKYLKDIKWCRIDDPKGFKIDFLFHTNPFFKNSMLTKTYHMIEEDDPLLEKAIGTEIEWHPGMCLTEKVLKKKPKNGLKNTKPITEIKDRESFFKFFNPPQVPDDEEIDADTAEQLQNLMEQDYHIASTIRGKIIPHAVSWYTGEAPRCYEVITEDEDEDEDEDTDDDKDTDDDDDDKDTDDDDDNKDTDDQEDDEGDVEEGNDDADDEKSGRAATGAGQQGDRSS